MHVSTSDLGAMSGPQTVEARSLAQMQADIRVRLLLIGVKFYWSIPHQLIIVADAGPALIEERRHGR